MPLSCICACAAQQERIVGLVSTGGAITNVHGSWFTSVRAGHNVDVTAVTAPNDAGTWANIAWQHAVAAVDATATVARAPLRRLRISASLDNTKCLDLHFVELRDLVSTTGTASMGGDTWKCWAAAGAFADIIATPDPDWYRYRNRFVWTWADAGAHAGNNQSVAGSSARRRRVPLDHAGDVITVTATLYEDSRTITVRVCQPPVLQLEQLTFDGLQVRCDERGDFDRIWSRGRVDPNPIANAPATAVANPAGTVNSVLCFLRGTPMTITAEFSVATAPTDPELINIRGRATIAGVAMLWQQAGLAVTPAGNRVVSAPMVSGNLPNQVGCYDRVTIAWEMDGPDGRTTSLGQTSHLIYVLLAAPVAPLAGAGQPMPVPVPYWTLLEFTCRPAHGAITPAQLVEWSYAPLQRTTGDGNGPLRARDKKGLSYWLRGTDSAPNFHLRDLLASVQGDGRCGAWARLLVHMFALHGAPARLTMVRPWQPDHRFLVKNCHFTGLANNVNAPWTHEGGLPLGVQGRCFKDVGVAGQGKTNPAFMFPNHAIVEYEGQVYDPSYGMEPHPTVLSWEKAAIAGLAEVAIGGINPFMQDGHPMSIAVHCSLGFRGHTVVAGETMASIGAHYGTTGLELWNHEYNHALRAQRPDGLLTVQVNDIVLVPKEGTNIALLERL
jgi:hypothetical protein